MKRSLGWVLSLATCGAAAAFGPLTLPPMTTRHTTRGRFVALAAAAANDDDVAAAAAAQRAIALDKATKSMTAFTNKYLENTSTTLCSDLSVPAVVIKGLAEHKVSLGAPLCPCRFYDDKEKEAKDGYWNCPCVPMRERHECHCMLFLTEDNLFAGTEKVGSSLSRFFLFV